MPGDSWNTVYHRGSHTTKGSRTHPNSDHHPEQGSIQGRTVGTLSSNPEAAIGHRCGLKVNHNQDQNQEETQTKIGGWSTVGRPRKNWDVEVPGHHTSKHTHQTRGNAIHMQEMLIGSRHIC
uniref:(northern house mosquito) hypothetical protein n=1 Tax=Culex pipiens TaxID=7175 RepID=A0A8D8A209_CULPI